MKNIYSITAFLFLALLSVNMASALVPGNTGFAELNEGVEIDMEAIESFCSEGSCIFDDGSTWKSIIFKLSDDGGRGNGFQVRYDEDLNKYSLSVFTTPDYADTAVEFLPTALKMLSVKGVLIGATDEDLADIEEQLTPGLLLEGGSVPEGMTGSVENQIPDYNSLTALSFEESSNGDYQKYLFYGLGALVLIIVLFLVFKKKK